MKRIFKIVILFLVILMPFYIYLFWNLLHTSSPSISSLKNATKIIFTWNPVEIYNNIHNKWDSLYLTDDSIIPFNNYGEIKLLIEEKMEGTIYFHEEYNILFDDNGNLVHNKGNFIHADSKNIYKYIIFANEVNNPEEYVGFHRLGLSIYKENKNIKAIELNKYKKLTSNILEIEKSINYSKVDKRKLGTTILLDFGKNNDKSIFSISNEEVFLPIEFDEYGEILNMDRDDIINIFNN